jgi:trk system potassium uptake protein TrkA
MKRFVVIGLGIFGSGVAETLHEKGHEVIAIDLDEDKVNRVAARVSSAVVGDGRQRDVLDRIGAKRADAAIVSTGSEFGAAVLAAMALRDLKVKEVYVKVVAEEHARILEKLGVTETIFPERDSAIGLAQRLAGSSTVLSYFHLKSGFFLQEMGVPKQWIGKSLRELALPRKHQVFVVAVHDVLTDTITPAPHPDQQLKDSDTMLVAGPEERLEGLVRG